MHFSDLISSFNVLSPPWGLLTLYISDVDNDLKHMVRMTYVGDGTDSPVWGLGLKLRTNVLLKSSKERSKKYTMSL